METRQLQRTGKTSFTVTLPKTWVEAQNLKEKDQIWMATQTSGALLILPGTREPKPIAATFQIDNLAVDWITRELVSYYLAGADEIVATAKQISSQQRNAIRSASVWLIGLEIIDESSTKIVLKNLFDPARFPIPQNLRQMFVIGQSMLLDALKALDKSDVGLAQDVVDRDQEVDKLHFIINRQFNSLLGGRINEDRLGLTLPELSFYAHIAIQAERIADHAVKLATNCLNLPKKNKYPLSESLKSEADEVLALLERAETMVQNLNRTDAQRLIDQLEMREKAQKPEALPLVADSLDRIRRYILNIAEMTINYSVIKDLQ